MKKQTLLACSILAATLLLTGRSTVAAEKHNALLASGRFLHIPGPNPILVPGKEGAWDDGVIEAADALEDRGSYYLFYHGTGSGKGYQLGVATAAHPLGPFRKHGNKPVLEIGPKGSWDDRHVACAMILKEGVDQYTMWYSGHGSSKEHPGWSVGLATASHPLGPWKKHAANPILKRFGYVGGVVEAAGQYWLYTAHPIGSTGADYSPMSLAVADSPAGPWTPYAKNPVLRQGRWGEWDDGGYSEAEVLYSGGIFHIFYGGAKLDPERIRTRESIGYAYSTDGYHFTKYTGNPVAAHQANPNAAAFAEVHAIIEPPVIYLYHTLRYRRPPSPAEAEQFPNVEHLGVQMLVTGSPFRLDVPVLTRATLAPKTATSLEDCPPICLSSVKRVALTVECTYHRKGVFPLTVAIHSSPDGERYDTVSLHNLVNSFDAGRRCQKTIEIDTSARFLKVLVNNPDPSQSISSIKVTATLGG
ncbi:MAG: hypothetical protein HQ567_18955 [Candidatus Nealsonbacteria bacterium]|nr:hypothetical protein [Candidatus Nealsonbacteria bacterium]